MNSARSCSQSPWTAECLGGPWDGMHMRVYLGPDGEPAQLTLEPPRDPGSVETGLYHLTLEWRTGRAAWGWAP